MLASGFSHRACEFVERVCAPDIAITAQAAGSEYMGANAGTHHRTHHIRCDGAEFRETE